MGGLHDAAGGETDYGKGKAERCPTFPGYAKRLRWGFPDPSRLQGSQEEKLEGTRIIRDQIRPE
jgi:hypothetical protein